MDNKIKEIRNERAIRCFQCRKTDPFIYIDETLAHLKTCQLTLTDPEEFMPYHYIAFVILFGPLVNALKPFAFDEEAKKYSIQIYEYLFLRSIREITRATLKDVPNFIRAALTNLPANNLVLNYYLYPELKREDFAKYSTINCNDLMALCGNNLITINRIWFQKKWNHKTLVKEQLVTCDQCLGRYRVEETITHLVICCIDKSIRKKDNGLPWEFNAKYEIAYKMFLCPLHCLNLISKTDKRIGNIDDYFDYCNELYEWFYYRRIGLPHYASLQGVPDFIRAMMAYHFTDRTDYRLNIIPGLRGIDFEKASVIDEYDKMRLVFKRIIPRNPEYRNPEYRNPEYQNLT